MKTVCKKLLCLMLVAMLLVSATPFAFAAEGINVILCPNLGEANDEATRQTVGTDTDGKGDYTGIDDSYWGSEQWMTVHTKELVTADTVYTKTTYVAPASKVAAFWEAKEEATEPSTEATEPSTEATEPSTEATEPSTEATEPDKTRVTFINEYTDDTDLRYYEDGEPAYNIPAADTVKGYRFDGWYTKRNGAGQVITNGTLYNDANTVYYAHYIEDVDDGVSDLRLWVRLYVGGVKQGADVKIHTETFTDNTRMLKWLYDHEYIVTDYLAEEGLDEDYEWNPRFFYNYTGSEKLTDQHLKADGDKDVIVKVYAKKASEANVLLYVHTSKTSTVKAIYEMSGYTKGNTVTYADVKAEIKDHYKSYSELVGLYSEDTWEQLLDGEKPTAANGIKVEHNGTTKIHVILKDGKTGSSSTADSSNPKTGDNIMIAATTMALAGAALVTITELKKRKMI